MNREMQKRIYIETTIPSFYHTLRTDDESRVRQKWTRQWWSAYADIFILTSSAAVIEELREGTSEKTQDRPDLLKDVERTMYDLTNRLCELRRASFSYPPSRIVGFRSLTTEYSISA